MNTEGTPDMTNLDLTTLSISGKDLTGKHILVKPEILQPQYRNIENRVVLATGGFGCSPHTSGSAVFVTYLSDGEKSRVERYEVERFATDDEVTAAHEAGTPR